MKKTFTTFGGIILILIILGVGFGFYMYQTNPMVKAIVNNDESKLFYFPVKKVEELSEFSYEEISLKAEDTVTIYAYFFYPETDSVKASIFFIHGSGGNVGRYASMIEPLIDHGFQVYALDWCGFGKSDGKPMHINVLDDTKLAFTNMLERAEVRNTPIVVYGQSLGGQVAVRLTKEFENKIDALVLDGSIASFPSLAADFAPIEFLKKRIENNPDVFHQPYSAVEDIKDIKNTPKLIIQSSEDQTVTLQRGKALFENAREPKEFWQTEGAHILTLVTYPEETTRRIEELLK